MKARCLWVISRWAMIWPMQGDHGGLTRWLWFGLFCCMPNSARDRWKLGRDGMANGQIGGTPKLKSAGFSVKPKWSPCMLIMLGTWLPRMLCTWSHGWNPCLPADFPKIPWRRWSGYRLWRRWILMSNDIRDRERERPFCLFRGRTDTCTDVAKRAPIHYSNSQKSFLIHSSKLPNVYMR